MRIFPKIAFVFLTTLILSAQQPTNEKAPDLRALADNAVLPDFDLKDSTVSEGVESISKKFRQNNAKGPALNVLVAPPPTSTIQQADQPAITLSFKGVSAAAALERLATEARATIRWDSNAVFLQLPSRSAAAARKPRPAIKNNAGKAGEELLARYANVVSDNSVILIIGEHASDGIDKAMYRLNVGENPKVKHVITDTRLDRLVTMYVHDLSSLDWLRYTAELVGWDISLEKGEASNANSAQLIMRFTPAK
jgi:hypothetical protein